jgi:hypothetical protein
MSGDQIDHPRLTSTMACLRSIDHFIQRNSLRVNIAINTLLMFLCLISYALLITLYLTEGMNIDSLIYISVTPTPYALPPTIVIPLIGVTLTSATSALLTRSVEHSLWQTILRKDTLAMAGVLGPKTQASKHSGLSRLSLGYAMLSAEGLGRCGSGVCFFWVRLLLIRFCCMVLDLVIVGKWRTATSFPLYLLSRSLLRRSARRGRCWMVSDIVYTPSSAKRENPN